MRRGLFLGGLVVAAGLSFAVETAAAQKWKAPFQKRVQPKPPRPVVKMTIAMAGKRALHLIPDAKLLRVIRLSDTTFLVVVRKGNKVEKVVISG